MAKKSVVKTVTRNVRESVKQVKSVRKALAKKRKQSKPSKTESSVSYSIRDLPRVKGRTFAQLADSLRANSDILQSLLRPGERWAYEIGSDDNGWNKSYTIFATMRDLIDKLEYGQSGRNSDGSQKSGNEWIKAIKIVKFGRTPKKDESNEVADFETESKWRGLKNLEVKKRVKKQTKVVEGATKFVTKKGKKKEGKKPMSKIEIIDSLLNTAKGLEKALQDANKRIAMLEKSLNKKSKPAKKAASKPAKKATRKPAKKATRKPAKKAVKRVTTKRSATKLSKKVSPKKATRKQISNKKVSSAKKASKKANTKTRTKKGGRK